MGHLDTLTPRFFYAIIDTYGGQDEEWHHERRVRSGDGEGIGQGEAGGGGQGQGEGELQCKRMSSIACSLVVAEWDNYIEVAHPLCMSNVNALLCLHVFPGLWFCATGNALA